MYGSRKNDPNALPYLVSYVLRFEDGELSDTGDVPKPTVDLMKRLSLRRSDKEETPMTEEAKKL